uniref:Uncharacterized protein n=1 Tax=Arundo donax TaxID=35708 RepID=A0A0A9BKP5_ARUDO
MTRIELAFFSSSANVPISNSLTPSRVDFSELPSTADALSYLPTKKASLESIRLCIHMSCIMKFPSRYMGLHLQAWTPAQRPNICRSL